MVIVKKKNGKWRACVDFTNVNKSCPMNPSVLPIINQLLDAMLGCQIFSFLDAYSSYNQIGMNPKDEEKKTFVT